MSIQIDKPQHITSLSTSAILVCIEITGSTLQKTDNRVSDEVTQSKKAVQDAGKFVSNLLANDPDHRKVTTYRGIVNNWMRQITYPWGGGWVLLPMARYIDFMKGYENHVNTYTALVETFLAKYDSKVSDMAFKMGDLFNKANYPTVDELRRKFTMKLSKCEVPVGDFRVQVSHDLADELRSYYIKQSEACVMDVVNSQSEMLLDLMERISHSCGMTEVKNEDGTTKLKRNHLYASTIEQVLRLCDTLSSFNPANNMKLEDARAGLQQVFSGMNLDALKESDSLRASTKAQVDDILAKFRS
jgi:hypothetical protein